MNTRKKSKASKPAAGKSASAKARKATTGKAKVGNARAKSASARRASTPAAVARRFKASDELKLLQLVEDTIAQGANTAEDIHRAVMDLPATVLERVGQESVAQQMRKVQDASLGALYELIQEINREVAGLARDLLKQRQRTDR